jgi:periplasmic protein TonB
MSLNYTESPNRPAQAPPVEDDPLGGMVALQGASKPWFLNIFDTLRDLSDHKKQPPLQVTFRPWTEEDLLNSTDPALAQLVEIQKDKPFLKSLIGNVKELFSPTKLPPLQVTSRPLSDEELSALGFAELEKTSLPWYKTFFTGLKETIFPPKLPPLEVSSRPVQVKEMFGRDEYKSRSQLMSVAIHIGVVALLFALGTNKHVQQVVKNSITLVAPDIAPYTADLKPQKKAMGGGGGGGDNSPLPPSKGKLPRPDLKQFTPPMAVVNNPNPRLVMEPTIIAPPDAKLPQVNMPNFGDPFAKVGPPSNGPGSGGGIGTGSGGGVGSGKGGGYGPGQGGGFGGGAFTIGGGVSAPVAIFKVEPEYSEEARKAKFQGTVLLAIVVDEGGRTADVRVVRPLGMGLDEKAIEAVMKWRFKPGYKDGRPVPVKANVEVNFRLL